MLFATARNTFSKFGKTDFLTRVIEVLVHSIVKYHCIITVVIKCNFQTQWEKETDVRIQKNTVKRRVETILKKESFDLEQRREKYVSTDLQL